MEQYKGHDLVRSQDKYGHEKKRMDFVKANQYLQDLKKVFDDSGIPFFLFYGTLVGAMRDHDFVWFDDDVDVGVLYEDAKKINEVAAPILRKMGYYVCFTNKIGDVHTGGYIAKKDTEKLKVDFYALAMFKGERCYYHGNVSGGLRYLPYPKKHFEQFEEIEFKGARYKVPYQPGEFLEYLWGDWWVPHGGQFGIIPAKIVPIEEFKQGVLKQT